ncbi:MAG: HdeD family acid-resistance protein [Rhizobiaceae bacterium]|nr:HdeD family acid-resistance protein [Rhizobiaceae bacterium]
MTNLNLPDALKDQIGAVRSKWGWFVGIGVLLIILGLFAFYNVLAATLASVAVIGTLMLFAGAAEIVQAFYMRTWKHFFLLLLGGILYTAAGFVVFYNPLLATAMLTLMLAIFLVASGAARAAIALGSKHLKNWGWFLAGGIVTILAGLIIAIGWPGNSLWILGLFLAIDLTFQGWALIALGLALRE